MFRYRSLVLGWIVLALAFTALARAQVSLNGYVKTDVRARIKGNHRLTWNENRLDLKLKAHLSDRAVLTAESWVRSFGFPTAARLEDLRYRDRRAVLPWSVDLREAYVDFYGFLFSNLDVRVGKQRIAWGTADKINPTDNLNPKDFEDPLDFGRKLPVNALRATAYAGDWSLEAVYVPAFTPAVLPPPEWRLGQEATLPLPPGVQVVGSKNTLVLPPQTVKDGANLGFKISGTLAGYDVSASYVYTRDDMPLATSVVFEPTSQTTGVVSTRLSFPRYHVFGADLAGEFHGVGVWAEAAAFVPTGEILTTIVLPTQQGLVTTSEVALKKQAFVKYVLGGDYTFANGLYLNGQFVHGFYGERGRDNLQDYLMLAVEKRFLHDEVKLRLGGAAQARSLSDATDNYTWIAFPELSYYPVDNVELVLGAYTIHARGETTLAGFAGNDEVYAKIKVSF
ncbi:MAG: hypothetical protein GXO73_08375 [Calditrichaeota bacterium]|nr:hypothetical protein [Calditrichota bacterium]